jgi:predicted RNase H-like nuclease (RuvC/YqgF family)
MNKIILAAFSLIIIFSKCSKDDKKEDPGLKEIELMKKEEELRKKEEELVKRELEVLKNEVQLDDTTKIQTNLNNTIKKKEETIETELTDEQKIRRNESEYKQINDNLRKYTKKTRELTGFSTEGGELDVFSDGNKIRKLTAILYGETGKRLEEYYYENGKLIYIYCKLSHYDKPFGEVIKAEENKFYLSNNKLLQWIDYDNEKVNPESPEYKQIQREILNDSKAFLKLIKNE